MQSQNLSEKFGFSIMLMDDFKSIHSHYKSSISTTILDEFKDIMPFMFSKMLQLSKKVDHEIKLGQNAKCPTLAPYSMAPPKLNKL